MACLLLSERLAADIPTAEPQFTDKGLIFWILEKKQTTTLKVGDVLTKDKTLPSTDQHVHKVEMKTVKGGTVRPILDIVILLSGKI